MNMQDMNNTDLLLKLKQVRAAYDKAKAKRTEVEQEVLVRMGLGSWEYNKQGHLVFVERKGKLATGELKGIGIRCEIARNKRAGGLDAQSLIKAGVDIEEHRKPDIYAKEWKIVGQ